ncbi:MAG: hypothetical protein VW739_05160 [Pelagibacteraceae bacterium]
MKLLSLNNLKISALIFFFSANLFAAEEIDLWKKENLIKNNKVQETTVPSIKEIESKININKEINNNVILNETGIDNKSKTIYGLFEPTENNLTLDMWVNSEGTRVKDTIERINKIKLSSFSEEIFIHTLFTLAYLPGQNMTDEEFMNYKIDWLINNKKDQIISDFLNKNSEFPYKEKIIKYLVDENLAKGSITQACEKINLISNDVKDAYLDQFRILCFIKNGKQVEAQLVHDLLKEFKLSNKFFDDKVNYLLGLTDKEDKKIDDTNLLNFYLSSIAISDFDYKPNNKTDKKIWQYLAAANLLKTEDIENKDFIKEIELAANKNNLDFSYVLGIYKNIKFELTDFLNVDQNYKNLEPISSRALVYQKFLLSESVESKLKYLFLLKDLFAEAKLLNAYKYYLSEQLKEIKTDQIPNEYRNLVSENILIEEDKETLSKVKYEDNSYSTSKILKFYNEKNYNLEKTDKDFLDVRKKIKKNKEYEVTLKDALLFDALVADGYVLPKDIDYEKLKKDNLPPIELVNMVKNKEIGLVLLRIVELIGQDEMSDLDISTKYFINQLLIDAGLKKLRNKILLLTLPVRV